MPDQPHAHDGFERDPRGAMRAQLEAGMTQALSVAYFARSALEWLSIGDDDEAGVDTDELQDDVYRAAEAAGFADTYLNDGDGAVRWLQEVYGGPGGGAEKDAAPDDGPGVSREGDRRTDEDARAAVKDGDGPVVWASDGPVLVLADGRVVRPRVRVPSKDGVPPGGWVRAFPWRVGADDGPAIYGRETDRREVRLGFEEDPDARAIEAVERELIEYTNRLTGAGLTLMKKEDGYWLAAQAGGLHGLWRISRGAGGYTTDALLERLAVDYTGGGDG